MSDFIAKLVEATEQTRAEATKKANQEAEDRLAYLMKIAKLKAEKYPDLRIEYSTDRTVSYLCSRVINSLETASHSLRHGCGCHPSDYGDQIYLSLYIIDDSERIYSSPRQIVIGQCGEWCRAKESRHYQAEESLAEDLRARGISEKLIAQICGEMAWNSAANCAHCGSGK